VAQTRAESDDPITSPGLPCGHLRPSEPAWLALEAAFASLRSHKSTPSPASREGEDAAGHLRSPCGVAEGKVPPAFLGTLNRLGGSSFCADAGPFTKRGNCSYETVMGPSRPIKNQSLNAEPNENILAVRPNFDPNSQSAGRHRSKYVCSSSVRLLGTPGAGLTSTQRSARASLRRIPVSQSTATNPSSDVPRKSRTICTNSASFVPVTASSMRSTSRLPSGDVTWLRDEEAECMHRLAQVVARSGKKT
jgi:hypothetical protein